MISVVIPVYNTAPFLSECLDSIVSQSYRDLEIFCIDDGSTDESWAIIESYANRDSRIKPVKLDVNHGVPYARNLALDMALGEYLYYMDSDDWIDQNYLEEMNNAALRTGQDVVINRNWYKGYGNTSERKSSGDFGFIKPVAGYYSPTIVQARFYPVVWARLYKVKYLRDNNIRSPLLKGGVEDNFFTSLAEILQEKSYIFPGPFYHYRQRTGSLVSQPGSGFRHFENFRLFCDELKARGIWGLARLYYVPRKLVIENERQYDFIRSFFADIIDEVKAFPDLYSSVDLFFIWAMSSCETYSEWLLKYSPSAYLSYFKFIKQTGYYPSAEHYLTQTRF